MRRLTLGSLFDGSGGFPLAGLMSGIEPLWASEIEPFPIRVTSMRLPNMRHVGDINKIDGATLPPVDIITGGFPCQNLSVAGHRAGLHGERSGLFFEMVRVIEEMRCATKNKFPRYVVVENVPGMYTSNAGRDFREVLNALICIKDKAVSISMPQEGKWEDSGEIVADDYSLAWRTLNAQFWGVPQRRRRCFLVLDFDGESAGEILFNETRLHRDSETGGKSRKGTAANAYACTDIAVNPRTVISCELGAASRLGGHCWENVSGTLRASDGDNRHAVVYDARGNGCGEIANTITGDHNDRVTDYTAIVMNERQHALTVSEGVANTLTGTDEKGVQVLFEELKPKTLKIRQGNPALPGGRGPLIQDNLSATLSCNNDQTLFVPKVYGICSQASNSMRSGNPKSGVYEMETSRTLDTGACSGNGGTVVVMEGNGMRPSHKGNGVCEDISYTLNTIERHTICYQDKVGALCASDYKFPQQQQLEEGKAVVERVVVENYQHSGYREVEVGGTLKANGGDFPGSENVIIENRYIVRRLTPQECALLQGFPQNWCADLETPMPSDEEIALWSEIWEAHRLAVGKSKKPKSRNQIIKWLKNPHSDAAEYKLWGNGVALPCVFFVLGGIVYSTQNPP